MVRDAFLREDPLRFQRPYKVFTQRRLSNKTGKPPSVFIVLPGLPAPPQSGLGDLDEVEVPVGGGTRVLNKFVDFFVNPLRRVRFHFTQDVCKPMGCFQADQKMNMIGNSSSVLRDAFEPPLCGLCGSV